MTSAAAGLPVVVRYTLEEAFRRRVFLVVLLLTLAFLALYWLGADFAFEEAREVGIDDDTGLELEVLAGATLFGLAMFGTLFLAAVLAVFLTLGAVRGDAERGLLQPLVVRPLGRATFLLGRLVGAAGVTAAYTATVYAATAAITMAAGDWRPDQLVRPGLELAAAAVVIAALSLLGSVFLSATANGVAVFMIFGAGLTAGLLGQIGDALNSERLQTIAERTSWALPFEALYQDALHRITAETFGVTGIVLQLGPFGGAEIGGRYLPVWTLAYVVLVAAAAILAFARKDL